MVLGGFDLPVFWVGKRLPNLLSYKAQLDGWILATQMQI